MKRGLWLLWVGALLVTACDLSPGRSADPVQERSASSFDEWADAFARDIENYLKKLALVAPRIDEGIAEARAADAAGIRPPTFIIERTMQQIDGLLTQKGKASVFVSTLDERIGDGWYAGDPLGRIGYLNNMLWRARRLVVDTGLHERKWTRQQAIDYGIAPYEVERYVVLPGQACAYMIGQLKIVELRGKVKARLGDRFSIKEFHNAVMKAGSVPLPVLEAEIARAFP